MPQAVRHYWDPWRGRRVLNFNWDIIDHDSVVLVTAAEYHVTSPPSDEHRSVGDATITVNNINGPLKS